MFGRTCSTCGRNFNTQWKSSNTCYGCALTRLIGNGASEEGDINTALLTSGEMSDADARALQEDLGSIDHSREEEFQRQLIEDYYPEDHRWDHLEEEDVEDE